MIKSINIEDKQERSIYFHDMAEDSRSLELLLHTCYNNDITPTLASRGHGKNKVAYIILTLDHNHLNTIGRLIDLTLEIPTSEFKAGDTVKLNNVALYASSSTSKIANYKTGTYYIWSDDIKNDRIRITNSKSNVGKAAGVTGWVKVSDLSGDGSISAGDKLNLKNVALYASSTSTKVTTHKTGIYYLWSADVKNGRIRITNNKASVGKTACVTGWIDVDDI